MNYSSGAPVRQPVREVEEPHFTEQGLPEYAHSKGQGVARLRLLWANRRWLSRVALYSALSSALAAFLIPTRYESTARLMPPDSQSGAGLAMAAAAMSSSPVGSLASNSGLGAVASDLLGLKSTSDQFVGILKSRTVQDKLIQEFDLKKLYWDRNMEDARQDLASHTEISVERKSQIISITVTDKSARRAAAMGQAYVEELNRLVAELSTSSARRERIFLEERLKGVNQDLEAAEKEFSEFASKNTAIDVKEQGRAMVQAAAMLQGQLIAAQSQYEGLRQIYTDNNARVRSLKARIDELQHQLEKMGGKDQSLTDSSAHPGDSMYPSIRRLPLLGVTYADLYRRAKIQEAVLETLTKQYELARVQEAKEIPTVKVLDTAIAPDKKSFPPRTLIVILGTLFGLAIGAVWLFGNQAWSETDAQDPRKVLAQEVFATVSARIRSLSRNGSGDPSSNGGSWHWVRRNKAAEKDESQRP